MHAIRLKPGRDSSLRRHHPWVFSGAIGQVDGTPAAGETVRVLDASGQLLGVGGYSPQSQIRVRMYAFDDVTVDREFLRQVLESAVRKRDALASNPERSAFRLVYGESDGLPGLIVDRYDAFLVCQFQFAGVEAFKSDLVELLAELTGCQGIVERSDTSSREKEGLAGSEGLLWGNPPPTPLIINEHGLQFEVDIVAGQKTGFYLDQADNRLLVREYCEGRDILNCFAYTGGFSLAALQAGARHVTSVDSSRPALDMAVRNVRLNGFDDSRHSCAEGRVGNLLRDWQNPPRQFDLVVLDPPKFAEHKSQVDRAARAYKDLALQAARLIRPGGYLVTFSCSGSIEPRLFQKITADALLDARRSGEIVRFLHQSSDHPVALAFPESQYLKGLICRVNG